MDQLWTPSQKETCDWQPDTLYASHYWCYFTLELTVILLSYLSEFAFCWAKWQTPLSPVLKKQRHEFESRLVYTMISRIARLCRGTLSRNSRHKTKTELARYVLYLVQLSKGNYFLPFTFHYSSGYIFTTYWQQNTYVMELYLQVLSLQFLKESF